MAFLLFRPSFWLIVGWVCVWTYYVEAGLYFDASDKQYHIRQMRNSSRTTTEKWSHRDATLPNSSHSIFYSTNVTWVNKCQLLTVMMISAMASGFLSLVFS